MPRITFAAIKPDITVNIKQNEKDKIAYNGKNFLPILGIGFFFPR
ncbi:hypothetical protein [Aureibaculum flavum]|nr:hypothetical protein [Aureibaculum flavum]